MQKHYFQLKKLGKLTYVKPGSAVRCLIKQLFFFLFQDSETLMSMSRSEGGPISLSLGLKTKRLPSSPFLLIHFHGGGFVAQTSKSHEVRCSFPAAFIVGFSFYFTLKDKSINQLEWNSLFSVGNKVNIFIYCFKHTN